MQPCADLSYNWVGFALRGSEPVVLKLGVATDELEEEGRALAAFAGEAGVRLLDSRPGALLLERLQPGVSLWQLWDESCDSEHTEIAARLMLELRRPAEASFPTFAYWCRAFRSYLERFPTAGPIPREWVKEADGLWPTFTDSALLHGDLHHGNILQSGSGWKAIDPKGVAGDPAFEVGTLLRNPCDRILQVTDLRRLLLGRLEIFGRVLEMDVRRLAEASFCVCVLSACWSAACAESAEDALACARELLTI